MFAQILFLVTIFHFIFREVLLCGRWVCKSVKFSCTLSWRTIIVVTFQVISDIVVIVNFSILDIYQYRMQQNVPLVLKQCFLHLSQGMPPYKLQRQCNILFAYCFIHNFIHKNDIDYKYFREFENEEDAPCNHSVGTQNVLDGHQYHLGTSRNELAAWAPFAIKLEMTYGLTSYTIINGVL